jgi:hypothetical protein
VAVSSTINNSLDKEKEVALLKKQVSFHMSI